MLVLIAPLRRAGRLDLALATAAVLGICLPLEAADPPAAALERAIQKGDLAAVRALLAGGMDPNARLPGAGLVCTPLVAAIHANQSAITQVLLDAGADPSLEDPNGDPAMVHAADQARQEQARILIAHGVGINSRNRQGINALMRGAPYEEAADVKAKLELGANPDLTGPQGNTALMIAATYGNLAAVEVLVQAGAKLDLRNHEGNTALLLAARRDSETGLSGKDRTAAIIRVLAKHGADVNARTAGGDTALMAALDSWGAGQATIEALLEFPPDLRIRNHDGRDALFMAADDRKRRAHVAKLLELGAGVNTTDADGLDLLMLAARNGDAELLNLFLHRGLRPTRTDRSGRAAAHHAIPQFDTPDPDAAAAPVPEILTLLRAHGASLTAPDEDGNTPLHLAAQAAREDAFRWLFPQVPARSEPNRAGRTPLHLAAAGGSVPIIELLLAKGANVAARDAEGATPLRLAARNREQAAILRLRQAGANIDDAGPDGITALAEALARDDLPTARFLVENGADPRRIPDPDRHFRRAVRRFHDQPGKPGDNAFLIELLAGLVPDINRRDPDGITALMWTAASDNPEALRAILRRRPYLEARSPDGRTALLWAACAGATQSMAALRAAGADGQARDAAGKTAAGWLGRSGADHPPPSIRSAVCQTSPAVRILESRRAALRAYLAGSSRAKADRVAGLPPLHLAAALGETAAIGDLILGGAAPNLALAGGSTPLMEAAANGQVKAIELLLAKGAEPALRDSARQRAIDHAVALGQVEAARLLLRQSHPLSEVETPLLTSLVRLGDPGLLRDCLAAGAAIPPPQLRPKDEGPFGHRPDDRPGEPLAAAARHPEPAMLQVLFDFPAATGAGEPGLLVLALQHAAECGRLANVRFLVETKGVDVNGMVANSFGGEVRLDPFDFDSKGYTALSRAVEEERWEIVGYLLQRGAAVAGRTRDGSPPLTFAVRHRQHDLLRLFLEHAAPTGLVDLEGNTALHHAASRNDDTAVRLLLEHGADPGAANPEGLTPLDLARRENARAAIALLDKRGP